MIYHTALSVYAQGSECWCLRELLACFFPGRPAFIAGHCEDIEIADPDNPPDSLECVLYCHPTCQSVKISDIEGTLFSHEVSLSAMSAGTDAPMTTLTVSKQDLIH